MVLVYLTQLLFNINVHYFSFKGPKHYFILKGPKRPGCPRPNQQDILVQDLIGGT